MYCFRFCWSHPSWVCGLKPRGAINDFTHQRHTLRGCVDWNTSVRYRSYVSVRHTLRGCVDWNIFRLTSPFVLPSHTLRGCVDWNINTSEALRLGLSHTLRGCVDWNTTAEGIYAALGVSHPSWVCGLKLWMMVVNHGFSVSHPSWVCGLKLEILIVVAEVLSHTLRGCVDWNKDTEPDHYEHYLSHPS